MMRAQQTNQKMTPALASALKEALNSQQNGQIDKAITAYQAILRNAPHQSDVHHLLGIAWLQNGEPEKAEHHIREALALHGDHPGYYKNLGLALHEQKKYRESIGAFEKSLSMQPDSLTVIINLGRAHSLLGNHKKSAEYVEKAFALAPDNNTIILAKADLFLFEGKMDEAKKLYKKLTKDKHFRVGALVRIIQYLHKIKDPKDKIFLKLEECAAQINKYAPDTRAGFHAARAKALDDLGRYDEAMIAMQKSSQEKKELQNYSTRNVEASYLDIKRYFKPEIIEKYQAQGSTSKKPVFIVGMPRSGTTLLEQILHSHSKIAGIGESNEFWELINARISLPDENGKPYPYKEEIEIIGKTKNLTIPEAAQNYLDYLDTEAPGMERVINKAITNLAAVPMIKTLFPNAKIIHIRRHALDNCISGYFKSFNDTSQPYTHDLKTLGEFYRIYRQHMEHFQSLFGDEIFDVQYEDIVENIEEKARALIDYLEMEWEDACLEFYKTEKLVYTASATQVRQPIYRSSLNKWKRYQKHLKPLIEAMGEYAPEDAKNLLQ